MFIKKSGFRHLPAALLGLFFPLGVLAGENSLWMGRFVFPDWAASGKAGRKVDPADKDSARLWMRHVIPLPKMVRLEGGLTLPARDIRILLRPGATDVEKTAADELENLVAEKTGVVQPSGPFQILIGVCDGNGRVNGIPVPGAERLPGLANKGQAYAISPLGDGLAVTALSEKGVYYGVKTLQQMMRPFLGGDKAVVPVTLILDWPDLAERGQWGSWEEDPDLTMKYIRYMAERKMNLMEMQKWMSLSFDAGNRGTVDLDTVRRSQARLRAIHDVFITEHVMSLDRTGLFERYPKVKGVGEKAYLPWRKDMVAPCASNPDFAKVLSEWLESCASQGVPDVSLWLSEIGGMQCGCERCKNTSQYLLETRAFIKAWAAAHEKYPDLTIRILTSQGTVDVNGQVLAEVTRPETRVTYYSGNPPGTYYPVREPIIPTLFENFAKDKGGLGCYPLLSSSWKYILPWSCPHYIKSRMSEFVEKGLTSFAGYVAENDSNDFYDFNITAAAEWSWNAHGRSEREFAASWATCRGMKDPETFADWAVMMGPVSWDLYGSLVPHPHFEGTAAAMINNRVKPALGKGMFLYFPTLRHLDDDLAVSRKALGLAQQLGDGAVIAETRAVQGYLEMIRAVYSIADVLSDSTVRNADKAKILRVESVKLQDAGKQTVDALGAWAKTVAPDYEIRDDANPAIATRKTINDIAASLRFLGIK